MLAEVSTAVTELKSLALSQTEPDGVSFTIGPTVSNLIGISFSWDARSWF